jgi:25S rRNA (adenine2142-N1)-methyltransferase
LSRGSFGSWGFDVSVLLDENLGREMGGHRKAIRRKKPLGYVQVKGIKRRDAIRVLHTEMKSKKMGLDTSIPLSIYQNASSKGQSLEHGGDSSKVLVKWLAGEGCERIRVLEVGCLEVDNAIGKFVETKRGSIRRIDLKSRDPRIEEQDFMTLEMPREVPFLMSIVNVEI